MIDSVRSRMSLLVFLTLCFVLAAANNLAVASDENESEIEAQLGPCPSPCVTVPGAKGEVGTETEFLADGVTVKEAEFEAIVQIPIPNSIGIDATNAANPEMVTLDLSRLNPSTLLDEAYATCTMVLRKIVGKQTGTKAMYALKVQTKLKNGQYVAGKKQLGSCDIDLLAAGVQSGVPAVQAGDTVQVVANGTDILAAALGSEDEEEEDDD